MTVNSGYWRSQRRPLREVTRSSSRSINAMARTPSHFTSKRHSAPPGGCAARVASMGSMAAGMAALRAPFTAARSVFSLGFEARDAGGFGSGGAEVRAFLAGRLEAHTRPVSPAVWRLVLRAGRLRAISSWVRPESTAPERDAGGWAEDGTKSLL